MKKIITFLIVATCLSARQMCASEKDLLKKFAGMSFSGHTSPAMPEYFTRKDEWCRIHFTGTSTVLCMKESERKRDPKYYNLPCRSETPTE